MKIKRYFYQFFILSIFACILSSCSQQIVTGSERLYAKSTIKHRQFVEKSDSVSIDEWRDLIDQFQRVLDLEPDGKNADDALYAIGSCWMWMDEARATPTTLSRAIEAFERLIEQYPESNLVPDVYWWAGHCYSQLGDYEHAVTQYQNLTVKFPAYKNYDKALYRLAECYEKQGHVPAAIATYQAIVENSKEKMIVEQASQKLSNLAPVKPEVEKTETDVTVPEVIDEQDTSSLVKQLGLGVHTIVIDPGHGGKDPGAVNGKGLCEKQITLAIGKKLKEKLDQNYQVFLTREDDTYLTLKGRTEYAIQQKADLFVSIHVNSWGNSHASGIETYYLSLASDESAKRTAAIENAVAEQNINDLESLVTMILKDTKVEESRRFAELVQESIVDTVKPIDRGVKRAPFIVLIGRKMPAILVETGFISNPKEAKLLSSGSYQDKIAEAIADAIEKYN